MKERIIIKIENACCVLRYVEVNEFEEKNPFDKTNDDIKGEKKTVKCLYHH